MIRRALALTLLALLGLWHPGHALATPGATAAEDIPIAEAFWGGPPTQCTSVVFGTEVLLPGAGGEATIPQPGWSGPCRLEIHEVEPATGYTREWVCIAAIHEEGHLHGLGHSEDPTDIMAPAAPPAAVAAPICEEPPAPRWLHPRRRLFRRGEVIAAPARI